MNKIVNNLDGPRPLSRFGRPGNGQQGAGGGRRRFAAHVGSDHAHRPFRRRRPQGGHEQGRDQRGIDQGGGGLGDFGVLDQRRNGPGRVHQHPGDEFHVPHGYRRQEPGGALRGAARRQQERGGSGVPARELDARMFKYVGVAGVDKRRIVQVGVSKADTP